MCVGRWRETATTDEELRCLAGEGFWRKLAALDRQARVRLLVRLLDNAAGGLEKTVKRLFASLPHGKADELSRQVSDGL